MSEILTPEDATLTVTGKTVVPVDAFVSDSARLAAFHSALLPSVVDALRSAATDAGFVDADGLVFEFSISSAGGLGIETS